MGIYDEIMFEFGFAEIEIDIRVTRTDFKSRGAYIVGGNNSRLYLHKDGVVRDGVKHNGEYAFWPTLEDANSFLQSWRDSKR